MSLILDEFISPKYIVPLAPLIYLIFKYFKTKTYNALRNIPGPPEGPYLGNLDVVYDCCNFYEINYKIYRLFDKYGSMFKLWMCHELWICISDVAKIKELFDHGLYNIVPVFNYFNYNSKKTLVVSDCPYKRLEYDVTLDPIVDNDYIVNETENLISHLETTEEQSIETTRKTIERNVRSILLNTQWKVRLEKLNCNRCGNWFLNRYIFSILNFLNTTQIAILKAIFKNFNVEYKGSVLFDDNPDAAVLEGGVDVNTVRLEITQSEHSRLQENLTPYVEEHILLSSRRIAGFLVQLLQNIAAQPKIKKAVQEEIKRFYKNKPEGSGGDTMKNLDELKYTDMVIKEGLRLYSPPAVFKSCKTTYYLDAIPSTAVLYISAYHIHRNHEHYQNPCLFYPEHFTVENEAKRATHAYFPLQLEPFNSLDKNIGVNILKLLLVKLISNFSFETSVPFDRIEHEYFNLDKKITDDTLKLTPLKKK